MQCFIFFPLDEIILSLCCSKTILSLTSSVVKRCHRIMQNNKHIMIINEIRSLRRLVYLFVFNKKIKIFHEKKYWGKNMMGSVELVPCSSTWNAIEFQNGNFCEMENQNLILLGESEACFALLQKYCNCLS